MSRAAALNTRVSELFNSLALEGGKRRAPDSVEPAPPADLSADAHNALVRTHLRQQAASTSCSRSPAS